MSVDRTGTILERLARSSAQGTAGADLPLPDGKFLGIVGLTLETPTWDVANALRLQPIFPPPGIHELARVLTDDSKAAIIGRYTNYVSYELTVAPTLATGPEALGVANSFISALRVRTLAEFLVPAALPCSWSVASLNALPARSVDADLIEDVPSSLQIADPRPIPTADIDWIFEHLSTFALLKSTNAAYALAADALCQHNHQTSLRMAASMLWSGIEALFKIKGEITHRLATYVASILEEPGESRFELFKSVKQEYNIRSRVVHGDSVQADAIRTHIINTRALLSRLICRITESQGLPSMEDLDRSILCGSATLVAPGDVSI